MSIFLINKSKIYTETMNNPPENLLNNLIPIIIQLKPENRPHYIVPFPGSELKPENRPHYIVPFPGSELKPENRPHYIVPFPGSELKPENRPFPGSSL